MFRRLFKRKTDATQHTLKYSEELVRKELGIPPIQEATKAQLKGRLLIAEAAIEREQQIASEIREELERRLEKVWPPVNADPKRNLRFDWSLEPDDRFLPGGPWGIGE